MTNKYLIPQKDLPFNKKYFTRRQRIIFWLLYLGRNFLDIIAGVVGILSLGFIQIVSTEVSATILWYQMKFYKEIEEKKKDVKRITIS